MPRAIATGRGANRRNNSILYNGDFEIRPAVLTAPTNVAARWIDGTASGSQAKKDYGWSCPSGAGVGANSDAGYDTTIFRSGTGSMRLRTLTGTGTVAIATYRNTPSAGTLFEQFQVQPNTTYTLTGYMRTNNVASLGGFIDFREYDAAGTAIVTTNSNRLSGTDTSWREVTLTKTTHANTRFASILIRNGVTGNISELWVDDVTLTPTVPTRVQATGRVTQ